MGSQANRTSLLQAVITGLFERSSPDMLWLVNRASELIDDPMKPGLLKFGAFLVGRLAAGQGLLMCKPRSR